MRLNPPNLSRSSWLSVMLTLASLVLLIGILYWAREVLIPIALAILFTFILAPVVTMFRRLGLGRTLSTVGTVLFASALLGLAGMVMVGQFRDLANDLPGYRQNIRKKISDLRLVSKDSSIEKVQETIKEAVDELKKDSPPKQDTSHAMPVVITDGPAASRPSFPIIGSLLEQLASAGLVIVLVIFMLLRREDLRDRLVRLAGYGRLAATTKAIDEAGKGVSRYLLRQCLLNTGFGIAIGIGLYFIGVPYAVLWGFLAGVARFIPYAGPWLGALAPILLSLAVFDSWTAPLLVIGLVIGLELINNMILEPLLYGHSIGVSEVALLIMIAFWTWLWGPIGMVLATPLTVCLMVISKSVPDLEFIGLLLSREPALETHDVFYQRLVAKDQDDALEMAEDFLEKHSRVDLFEQLLIPTLIASRADFRRSRLTSEDQQFIFRTIRQILETLNNSEEHSAADDLGADKPAAGQWLIVGCPTNDEANELALLMLAQLLRETHWEMRVLSARMRHADAINEIINFAPQMVCVAWLPTGAQLAVRQFCRQLRSSCPELPLVAGCWGKADRDKAQQQLSGVADTLTWTIAETVNKILQSAQPDAAGGARPQPGRPAQQPLLTRT